MEVRLFEPAGAPDPKSMEVRTKRPRMTPGREAIVKVLDTYRELNYGLCQGSRFRGSHTFCRKPAGLWISHS